MSRTTVVATLAGALLVGGLSAPALADPYVPFTDKDTTVCVLTEPSSGAREGICVWVPIGPKR
jgi:hypothetical protein